MKTAKEIYKEVEYLCRIEDGGPIKNIDMATRAMKEYALQIVSECIKISVLYERASTGRKKESTYRTAFCVEVGVYDTEDMAEISQQVVGKFSEAIRKHVISISDGIVKTEVI